MQYAITVQCKHATIVTNINFYKTYQLTAVHASYTELSLQIKAVLPRNTQFAISLVHTSDSLVLQ